MLNMVYYQVSLIYTYSGGYGFNAVLKQVLIYCTHMNRPEIVQNDVQAWWTECTGSLNK
jgi:hypothetical protein